MRLDDYRTSDNVRDDGEGSGPSFGGGGGGMLPLLLSLVGSRFGIVGVLLVIGATLLFGGNPLALLGGGSQAVQTGHPAPTQQSAATACSSDPDKKLACQVLASTEDTWGKVFQKAGSQYAPTTLVFYSKNDQSGCGAAQSAMGPFYCPTDKQVYLDVAFYDELAKMAGTTENFTKAYVVAHEVGHHVQDMLGLLDKVHQQQAQASPKEANALQVRVELQADCYAGVWAGLNRDRIEPDDLPAGMQAAKSIGDDELQEKAQGRVVPDSFTHGTSAQRMEWLKKGYDSADPGQCDTFAAGADA